MPKPTLLIVEDDLDIAEMLSAYFRVQDYETLTANWGEDGVQMCQNHHPDLVILDIMLPDIDGFEVARQIRSDRRTREIPIIFLTEKRERSNRLKGLELQADDYITKPFDIQELRLRVRNTLQRVQRGPLTNPVTGIPEGTLVDEHLEEFLRLPGWTLLLVSLKNLNRFRDIYGFVASDDLLRAVTLMIQDSMRQFGEGSDVGRNDFLGHISATDLLIFTRLSQPEDLKKRIENRLLQSFDYFYRDQDRDSDVFKGQHLAVSSSIITNSPSSEAFKNIQQVKDKLTWLCNQAVP
jgi:DNA-binding response OmpR family regulator